MAIKNTDEIALDDTGVSAPTRKFNAALALFLAMLSAGALSQPAVAADQSVPGTMAVSSGEVVQERGITTRTPQDLVRRRLDDGQPLVEWFDP